MNVAAEDSVLLCPPWVYPPGVVRFTTWLGVCHCTRVGTDVR
jgi:hypothetical protein